MATTTFYTYPDLVTESADRKAATCWGSACSAADAVAATIHRDTRHNGLAPGGLG
jgi:hypothetical protein